MQKELISITTADSTKSFSGDIGDVEGWTISLRYHQVQKPFQNSCNPLTPLQMELAREFRVKAINGRGMNVRVINLLLAAAKKIIGGIALDVAIETAGHT